MFINKHLDMAPTGKHLSIFNVTIVFMHRLMITIISFKDTPNSLDPNQDHTVISLELNVTHSKCANRIDHT